jgi:hypothetical protein
VLNQEQGGFISYPHVEVFILSQVLKGERSCICNAESCYAALYPEQKTFGTRFWCAASKLYDSPSESHLAAPRDA